MHSLLHLISCSPHFIVHVSFHFFQSALHCSCFSFISFSPQSISFISSYHNHTISFTMTIFGCTNVTSSLNLIVTFTFQPIPSLEINNLGVSIDTVLICDRYSLLEAELPWFYYSLSLYYQTRNTTWCQKKRFGLFSSRRLSVNLCNSSIC